MASYRPKIKLNASGETRDLPLDAETLKGKTLDYFASKSEMNSGLANKQNNLSQPQLEAVNSGITSSKVSKYDGYASQINDKATASNVYSKTEVDNKDANTLNNAKTYTDTQLKTVTDNIVKEVICTHQYEITGNTGDEHGLAVEDQQMLIKKIEGQTKVVNGRLVNSNCVLKSSGRNLIDITSYINKVGDFIINENSITLNQNDTIKVIIIEFFKNDIVVARYVFNTTQTLSFDKIRLVLQNTNGVNYNLDYEYYNVEGNSFGVYCDISSDKKTLSNVRFIYKENTPYEPFKEDTIDGIGSLGQWDYIDMISQKKVLPTSDIVTLNGSENWSKSSGGYYALENLSPLVDSDINSINIVSNNLTCGTTNQVNPGIIDNSISAYDRFITIRKNDLTSVEQLKQWLAQNPIQLVYKKAIPTIVDIDLPSGYAVYNGGLQSQVGQVPYKITKQYNLSQKAQTLANIEIDREQQGQITELKNTTENQQGQIAELENKVDKFKFNLYRHDCSVSTNDGTFYFEFWCDSNTKLDLPSKWQSVKFWGGSGAISNTGSIENGQQASVFKKGTQLFYYTTSQNNLLIARYINTDNVNTYSVYDFFGNKVA